MYNLHMGHKACCKYNRRWVVVRFCGW